MNLHNKTLIMVLQTCLVVGRAPLVRKIPEIEGDSFQLAQSFSNVRKPPFHTSGIKTQSRLFDGNPPLTQVRMYFVPFLSLWEGLLVRGRRAQNHHRCRSPLLARELFSPVCRVRCRCRGSGNPDLPSRRPFHHLQGPPCRHARRGVATAVQAVGASPRRPDLARN